MVVTAVDQEHRVTPRELFFALVFAFTQVATLLSARDDGPGTRRAGAGHHHLAGVAHVRAVWWRDVRAESRSMLTCR
jgi:low temperature requirement protein LtrA